MSDIPAPPEFDKKQYDARKKYRFSIPELCEMFNTNRSTLLKKLADTEPAPSDGRRSVVYDIGKVAELIDRRNADSDASGFSVDEDGNVLSCENPKQMKEYFQGKEIQQSYLLKKQKYEENDNQLLPADIVERQIANAFKSVANFLDALPDLLERKGIVKNSQVMSIIKMTDKVRLQMSDDLAMIHSVESEALEDAYNETLDGEVDET